MPLWPSSREIPSTKLHCCSLRLLLRFHKVKASTSYTTSIVNTPLIMRRLLPRTLLRLSQQTARRAISAPLRRPNSTLPPAPSSSDASASSSSDAVVPTTPQIPLTYIDQPAAIPPSFESLRRNVPLKVKERREQWPDHPSFTREPYTDPDVFDVDRSSQKRLPHEMEIQFEHMRSQGFFPGDSAVARTHFIDIMRLWRGRIRGREGQVWDATRKEWQTASRLVFFLEQMKEKGLPLPEAEADGVAGVTPLSDRDVFLAGLITIQQLEDGEINAEAVESVLGVKADEYTFAMHRGQLEYGPKDGSEGITILNEDTFRTYHESLLNWPAIISRYTEQLDAANRQSHRTRVVGHRVYLPNVTIRLTRNFTPPGQPYDPYIATFRIPPSMTKQDLRSYLKAVYNLDVSFVRTVVYWGEVVRDPRNGRRHRQKGGVHNYKKAVVGLYEPFHYPDDVQELRAISRAQGRGDKMYVDRMNSINSSFYIREQRDFRKKLVQAVYKRSSYGHRSKGEGQSRVSTACICWAG